VNADAITWRTLPDFGRTLGGVTSLPVTATNSDPAGKRAPHLEYDVWLFSTGELNVELQLAPSLDFQSGEGLQFAISLDEAPPKVLRLETMANQANWNRAVADGVRRVTSAHKITRPGHHVLKLWRVTPGVVFERIVIDTGGVRPSYLGPPESPQRVTAKGPAES
jgi:hypothetical protein